jgi:hypothetical protein
LDAGAEGGGRITSALQHISAITTGQVKLPLYAGPVLSHLAWFMMVHSIPCVWSSRVPYAMPDELVLLISPRKHRPQIQSLCLFLIYASQAPGPTAVVAPGSVVASGSVVAGAGTMNPQVKLKIQEDGGDARGEEFVVSHGLSTAEAQILLRMWGRNELVEKATSTWWIIFRQVMPENSPCRPRATNMSFESTAIVCFLEDKPCLSRHGSSRGPCLSCFGLLPSLSAV